MATDEAQKFGLYQTWQCSWGVGDKHYSETIEHHFLIGKVDVDKDGLIILPSQDVLRCEICHRRIEALTEDEALNDMDAHGWTNWKTAHSVKCFDCANDYDEYETYYAGRIKRGYPNRVYRLLPDLTKKGKLKYVDCYFERTRAQEIAEKGSA
jgi:hypothetical protein